MPKNEVNDAITDQEIAFAHLVLSGAMTDRRAAEAVGLNPDSAASTKAKPRVCAYMLQHRTAVQQQLEGLRHFNLDREQVLARLWQIANLGPEMTRGSVTGQVKSLSIIVAMEDLIPDRRAASSEKKSAPAPVNAEIYQSAWLREQKAATDATTNVPQPTPPPAQEEDSTAFPGVPWGVPAPDPASSSVAEAPPNPGPSQPTFAHRVPLADGVPPYVPLSTTVPDTRVPFSIKKTPFARHRL